MHLHILAENLKKTIVMFKSKSWYKFTEIHEHAQASSSQLGHIPMHANCAHLCLCNSLKPFFGKHICFYAELHHWRAGVVLQLPYPVDYLICRSPFWLELLLVWIEMLLTTRSMCCHLMCLIMYAPLLKSIWLLCMGLLDSLIKSQLFYKLQIFSEDYWFLKNLLLTIPDPSSHFLSSFSASCSFPLTIDF